MPVQRIRYVNAYRLEFRGRPFQDGGKFVAVPIGAADTDAECRGLMTAPARTAPHDDLVRAHALAFGAADCSQTSSNMPRNISAYSASRTISTASLVPRSMATLSA